MTNPTSIETLLTKLSDQIYSCKDDRYLSIRVAEQTSLIEAFREVLGALNHISQYDAPAKGGEYTKVWMRLGKKASEALARANEIVSTALANEALGETKS